MKALLSSLLALLVLGLGAFTWTLAPSPLPLPDPVPVEWPPADPPPDLKLGVVHAGRMHSRAGLAYRGGDLGESRVFGMAAIVIDHPDGVLIVDTGFGRDVDAQMSQQRWLLRVTSTYDKAPTAAEQLRDGGFDFSRLRAIVLTHSHWDHVSGLPDFPGAAVWLTEAEYAFVRSGHPMAELAGGFKGIRWTPLPMDGGPYLGFERSQDAFGDGSVVLVQAPGHTPGSLIVFVTLADGRRYALVGDLVWQREGIEIPAERPWLPRTLADVDPAGVRRWILHLRNLRDQESGLTIVPAHDQRVLDTLPAWRARATPMPITVPESEPTEEAP